jgi:hypothetical protein
MTAEAFADLVGARPAGTGRWAARCPAHADRSPSLSIRVGDDERVLLRCFAGCTVDSILAVLKLGRRDLFAGPPPTPQLAAALRAVHEGRDHAAKKDRRARLDALKCVETWQSVVNSLGAKLARSTEDDNLFRLFHAACDQLHRAETEYEQFDPKRRASAQVWKGSQNEHS